MRSRASRQIARFPARCSSDSAAKPATPAPMTITSRSALTISVSQGSVSRMMSEVKNSSFSETEFRSASGLFPTGVTVVTRKLSDGRPYGMTVSSFTSVSLHPPMILVCIDKRAGFLQELEQEMVFAVNVLHEEQQQLAARFSRAPESSRFEGVAWAEGRQGVPLIRNTVASFVCSLAQNVDAGDHRVLIGTVEEIHRESGYPLVWCGSAYHCLPRPRDQSS
jgi:(E)-2-((N-methylformamido)methylene)succinate hydrolase